MITQIAGGSPAQEAGLRRGDVILEVDQQAVPDAAHFQRMLRGKEKALLLVRRGEATVFIALKREAG